MFETTQHDKLTVSASVLVFLGIVARQLAAVALGQGLENFWTGLQSGHVTVKKMVTFLSFQFLQNFISAFTVTLVDG